MVRSEDDNYIMKITLLGQKVSNTSIQDFYILDELTVQTLFRHLGAQMYKKERYEKSLQPIFRPIEHK